MSGFLPSGRIRLLCSKPQLDFPIGNFACSQLLPGPGREDRDLPPGLCLMSVLGYCPLRAPLIPLTLRTPAPFPLAQVRDQAAIYVEILVSFVPCVNIFKNRLGFDVLPPPDG